MAKLTNLFARPRGRIVQLSFLGLMALVAFVLLQFGATQWAHAQQVGADFDHASTGYVLNAQHRDVRCETCHLKGVFKGTPKDCVSCHGWNNPRANMVMPTKHIPTNNATCESCHQANMAQFVDAVLTFNHAAVQPLTCVNCHSSNNPHPDVRTNPVDATHMAVMAKGQACDKCHTTVQFTGPKIPLNHIPPAAVACESCHTTTDYSVMPTITNIHAFAPSTSSNCAQCHSATNAATYSTPTMVPPVVGPVANHIAMSGQSCEVCHVGPGSSLATTPVQEGAKFMNSLFKHNGISTGCDTCHGYGVTASSFYGVTTMALSNLSPGHLPVPSSTKCESCHGAPPPDLVPAAGMKTFANGQMDHTGITSGCDACHGANYISSNYAGSPTIVTITNGATKNGTVHIPAPNNDSCEACHSVASGKTAASVVLPKDPTGFQKPIPLPIQVHSAVSGNCNICHDAGAWTGVSLYPSNLPLSPVANGIYKGFQLRPSNGGGQYSANDGAHPPGGDCSNCHRTDGFGPAVLPDKHIPVASTARCGNCHTDSNFTTPPTDLGVIHTYIPSPTTNCVQCHDANNAKQFTVTKPIVTQVSSLVPNHVPTGSLSCETCHMRAGSSIPGGAVLISSGFGLSLFDHTTFTSNCEACHGSNSNVTPFTGIPNLTVVSFTGNLPHMKVGTNGCEQCHSNPTGLVSPTPGTSPTTFHGANFTHSGISTACATCHVPLPGVATFLGNPTIVPMPATNTVGGAQIHIPSSTTCENCHLLSVPQVKIPGSATASIGATGFRKSPPNSSQIHNNSDTTRCADCHEAQTWAGIDAEVAAYPRGPQNTPKPGALFTGFQWRPNGSGGTYSVTDGNHASTGDCSNCHTGFTGFGPPTPPTNHIPYSGACGSCHKDPDYSVFPAYSDIHKYGGSATTNCVQCHSADHAGTFNQLSGMKNKLVFPTAAGTGVILPHIDMATLSCESCHQNSLTGLTTTTTSFAGGQYTHSGTTGCNACHVSGTGPFQGTLNIIVMPGTGSGGAATSAMHLPTSTTCETCHSAPGGLLPAVATNAANNSLFGSNPPAASSIHTGVSGSCSNCHDAGGTSASDVWMNMAAYKGRTNVNGPAPYVGFQTRPNTAGAMYKVADSIHPPSGDCSACHSSLTDFSAAALPLYHIPTAAVACANCHKSTDYSQMPASTDIHANAPTTARTANCATCHSAANAANFMQLSGMAGKLKYPTSGHVDMGTTVDCKDCHYSATSGVTSISTLPVQTGAAFTGSAYIHTGVTKNCANCHGDGVTAKSFLGQTPKPFPAGHVPNSGSADCVACHLTPPAGLVPMAGPGTGQTFATTNYSHSGITATCQTCHATNNGYLGITNMVVLSSFSTHIPTNLATASKPDCISCHVKSTPSALVTWSLGAGPKTAPNTGFGLKSQIPLGSDIHAGVTSGCIGCHESTYSAIGSWLEVDTSYYNRTPTTKQSGKSYLGFNTRPILNGTGYSIDDGSHPLSGDCSNCHGSTASFSVSAVPTNHIPFKLNTKCDLCHTTIDLVAGNADFSKPVSRENIHLYQDSTSANCALCHSEAKAGTFNAGVGKTIESPATHPVHVPYGLPSNPVPCETCHAGLSPVNSNSSWLGGQFSHASATTGCATCHGNGLSPTNYYGISNLVAIPATVAGYGVDKHIPYSVSCETCHTGTGSYPSGLTPVTGSPATVTKFRLPKPTGGNIHGNISSGCNACHDTNYVWKGMDLAPITPSVITTNGSYTGFQTRPTGAPNPSPIAYSNGTFGILDGAHPASGDCSQCHTSTTAFSGVAKPAKHMPTTAACSNCHSPTDYSLAGLGGLANRVALHTNFGISAAAVAPATAASMTSQTCGTCHATTAQFAGCTVATANCGSPPPTNWTVPGTINVKPVHVPISSSTALTLDCSSCHAASVTTFVLPSMMKDATMHTSANTTAQIKCMSCHENGMAWGGVTGLKVRPSDHSGSRAKPNDCNGSGCHTYARPNGMRGLLRPVMRGALVSPTGRNKPTTPVGKLTRGSLGNTYDHKTVDVGKCKTCHDGKAASGMPARHLMVANSCDTCHRPTTWLPAQFNHNGVSANTCQGCHNGVSASAKPAGHFITPRSCDNCHKSAGWVPVNYTHTSPSYKVDPLKLTCVSCHENNGEFVRRQMRGLTRAKPTAVGP